MHGQYVTQLAPEKRFYTASQTNSTMVANHSTLQSDLYVIYMGKNPDTDRPIIKVFLNPLINWIWIGVGIVVLGTVTALVPSVRRALVAAPATQPAEALGGAVAHHA